MFYRADSKFPETFNLPHMDAGENIFFARELEQILRRQYDVKKIQLKALSFVPINPEIEPDVESFTYTSFDHVGKAELLKDLGQDVPAVNVFGKQTNNPMRSYGAAFQYDVDEIKRAARLGRPLEQMRADTARKAIDQQIDTVFSIGDSVAGLVGLLNLSSTDTYTVTTKNAGGTAWATATPDEILADMNGMISQVIVNTGELEQPDALLLPTAAMEIVANRARSAVSDTTILQFFQANRPNVSVKSWERLGTAGAGSGTRMVAYVNKPENVWGVLPIPFEMAAPEIKGGWTYKINCRARTGGVVSPYPKSVIYGDGI